MCFQKRRIRRPPSSKSRMRCQRNGRGFTPSLLPPFRYLHPPPLYEHSSGASVNPIYDSIRKAKEQCCRRIDGLKFIAAHGIMRGGSFSLLPNLDDMLWLHRAQVQAATAEMEFWIHKVMYCVKFITRLKTKSVSCGIDALFKASYFSCSSS